jgi:hypothetical protein
VDVGYVGFTPKESLDAIYDRHGGLLWGGGVSVNQRAGWFARVTASRFRAEGERAFVLNGAVFPLGIPSELIIVQVDVTTGWRFLRRGQARRPPQPGPPRPRTSTAPRHVRLVPFIGGGIGIVRLTERADFAQSGDDVEETHRSYHLLGGIEFPFARWFGGSVEGGWRWVPDALTGSGIANEFGESSLNHFFTLARFTIGR